MFGLLKKIAAPVAAVAIFAMTPAVRAEPIAVFDTAGQFGAGTTGGSTSAGQTILTIGTVSLIYHAANPHTVDSADFTSHSGNYQHAAINFGYFTVQSTDPTPGVIKEKFQDFKGATFNLNVRQFLPVVPTGEDEGNFNSKLVRGTVWYEETDPANVGTTGTSAFRVEFADPLSFVIPTSGTGKDVMTYSIQPKTEIGGKNQVYVSSGDQFFIGGTLTAAAVPLPGVAVAGLALMGGVAAVRRLRKPVAVA